MSRDPGGPDRCQVITKNCTTPAARMASINKPSVMTIDGRMFVSLRAEVVVGAGPGRLGAQRDG